MSPRPLILPVFIPFEGCPHRCLYCDQRAITGVAGGIERRDVAAEIGSMLEARRASSGRRNRAAEIAFYGGSFTSLPRTLQANLLEAAAPFILSGQAAGVRLSARPDAVDGEILDFLASGRVRTVELGAQSMDDAVLASSRRGHVAEDTRRAARLVRGRGLSLGLQMMTGLPGDTPAASLRTARELADLRPDFVRIYPAQVMEGTGLASLWRAGAYRPFDLEETLSILSLVIPLFRSRMIPVARVGLLLGKDGESKVLAGPRHPALGWLAANRIAGRRLVSWLETRGKSPREVRVNPSDLSSCLGKGRGTLKALRLAAGNSGLEVVSDAAVPPLMFAAC